MLTKALGPVHAKADQGHRFQRLGLDVLQQPPLDPRPTFILPSSRGLGSRKLCSQLVSAYLYENSHLISVLLALNPTEASSSLPSPSPELSPSSSLTRLHGVSVLADPPLTPWSAHSTSEFYRIPAKLYDCADLSD